MSMRALVLIPPATVVNVFAWAGVFPPLLAALASLATFIWASIEIWESDTVKGWTGRLPARVPDDPHVEVHGQE